MQTKVITIDGPTSSGKNSVGFLLAQKLGYQYVDSGSIYRAGCFFILKNNIPLDDLSRIVDIFENLQIEIRHAEIRHEDHQQRFIANGEDITDHLHDSDVTNIVPAVSAIKEVREVTKIIQYNLANFKNTVMTGRDIGSEIFPEATNKFYLTASTKVRAQRRFKQFVEKNPAQKFEEVLKSMEERDHQDTTREISPLRIPADAVVIDNSNLTVEETVEEMLKHIRGYA